jgi:hypothetical protein
MFVFKLFTINNILFYVSYIILVILLLFLSYKYLYLEQSNFVITSRLNKLEIELNGGISSKPITNISTDEYYKDKYESANEMMNQIYGDYNDKCDINGTCSMSDHNDVSDDTNDIEITVISHDKPVKTKEIFDLKKEVLDDNVSVISSNVAPSALTKKSLSKLSSDKLKAKCDELKISNEGTKNQLIDRIINYENLKVVEDEVIISDE